MAPLGNGEGIDWSEYELHRNLYRYVKFMLIFRNEELQLPKVILLRMDTVYTSAKTYAGTSPYSSTHSLSIKNSGAFKRNNFLLDLTLRIMLWLYVQI